MNLPVEEPFCAELLDLGWAKTGFSYRLRNKMIWQQTGDDRYGIEGGWRADVFIGAGSGTIPGAGWKQVGAVYPDPWTAYVAAELLEWAPNPWGTS